MIKSQYAGGVLLPPVQTLVATFICSPWEQMQMSPVAVYRRPPGGYNPSVSLFGCQLPLHKGAFATPQYIRLYEY